MKRNILGLIFTLCLLIPQLVFSQSFHQDLNDLRDLLHDNQMKLDDLNSKQDKDSAAKAEIKRLTDVIEKQKESVETLKIQYDE